MIYETETGLKKVIGTRRPRASRNPLTLTSSSEINPAITMPLPAPLVSQPGDFVTEEKLAGSLEELKSYMERSIRAGIKANAKKFDDLRDVVLRRIEISTDSPPVERKATSNEQPARVTSTVNVASSIRGAGTTEDVAIGAGPNSPGDNGSDDGSSGSSSDDLRPDAARAASEATKKLKKQMQQVEKTGRSSDLYRR